MSPVVVLTRTEYETIERALDRCAHLRARADCEPCPRPDPYQPAELSPLPWWGWVIVGAAAGMLAGTGLTVVALRR